MIANRVPPTRPRPGARRLLGDRRHRLRRSARCRRPAHRGDRAGGRSSPSRRRRRRRSPWSAGCGSTTGRRASRRRSTGRGLAVLLVGLSAPLVALMQALVWGWDVAGDDRPLPRRSRRPRRLRGAGAAHRAPAARRRPAAQPRADRDRAGDVRRPVHAQRLHHLRRHLLPARARLRPAAGLGRPAAGLPPQPALQPPRRRARPTASARARRPSPATCARPPPSPGSPPSSTTTATGCCCRRCSLFGVTIAPMFTSLLTGLSNEVPAAQRGDANALVLTVRWIGAAAGTMVLGVVVHSEAGAGPGRRRLRRRLRGRRRHVPWPAPSPAPPCCARARSATGGVRLRLIAPGGAIREDRARMRALVISDTHFGAWTGRDLLAEEFFLERLAPALEDLDELIFLGDLFDFLFGSVEEAVDASGGLLDLIGEKLAGGRLVFLAGNHDHHLVHRDEEDRLEAKLAAGADPGPPGSEATGERLRPRLLPRLPRTPPAGGRGRDRLPDLQLRRRPLHPRPLPRPARPPRRLARRPDADPDAVGDRLRRPGGAEDDRGLRVGDHAADRVALHRRPDAARHPRPAERLPRRPESRPRRLHARRPGARRQAAAGAPARHRPGPGAKARCRARSTTTRWSAPRRSARRASSR